VSFCFTLYNVVYKFANLLEDYFGAKCRKKFNKVSQAVILEKSLTFPLL
jgi:hypothetical protein